MSQPKYKINQGFVSQKLDDKTVIFDSDRSLLYTFNATAGFIFRKLKQGLGINQIVSALVRRYKIGQKKALSDATDLLNDLAQKKIITQSTE